MHGLTNQHEALIKNVSFPITREALRTFSLEPVHRKMAIENATSELAYIILSEVSNDQQFKRTWTHQPIIRVGNKLCISRNVISKYEFYSKVNGSVGTCAKITPDILPEIFEKLKMMFVGVGFSVDEFTSNIIVDWS